MIMRSMPAILLTALVLVSGCAGSRIGVAPPCASVQTPSPSDPAKMYRGQGILVGNRLLTAGHTFLQEGSPFPPNEILVNGRLTWVRSLRHGNIDTVRALYGRDGSLNPSDYLEDWVTFEVEQSASHSAAEWSVGNGKVVPNETLYAVRVDIVRGRAVLNSAPLTVVKPDSDRVLDERLIFVTNPLKDSLNGWSGCFVGRFDERLQRWEVLGILICGQSEKGGFSAFHIVLRPPASVLEWLAGR